MQYGLGGIDAQSCPWVAPGSHPPGRAIPAGTFGPTGAIGAESPDAQFVTDASNTHSNNDLIIIPTLSNT